MADYKLKIKVGDHEFEAEGPADVVQDQFAAFKELIGNVPKKNEEKQGVEDTLRTSTGALDLDKILDHDNRLVWPTIRAANVEEAILIVLLGQRVFNQNDSVTGAEIVEGLREAGQGVERVDHRLQRLADEGFVILTGQNRGKRYRLSAAGVTRSQEIARGLIALVP